MKRYFKIFYNDGVFAMDVTFIDKDDNFIKSYLQQVINEEFNDNINSLYHINFSNIIEMKLGQNLKRSV